jgi:Transcriptional regulator, AbiEi antitoxin/Protein of unknown function (DUF559)
MHPYGPRASTPDSGAGEWAARDWGVLSRDELRACGLSDRMIATRVRNGRLHRVHRGVYAVGDGGLTMRGRFLAAVKACGEGAALSHVSAAALWGLLTWDEERSPDVIARRDKRIPGIATHRTRHPPPTVRYDRIPVTTPERTLIDLSSVLPFKPLRRAVREALVRKRVTAGQARRIVKGGDQPTRSSLEDAVLDLIESAGLPTPDVNKPLLNGYVPDFRWPELHLILEADGPAYHDNPLAREDDARRQAQLEAQGETVIRVRGSPGSDPAPTA